MWPTLAGQRVSVEEYLRNPELEKLELVDGVLVETGAGDKVHAWIHAHCGSLLFEFVHGRNDLWAASGLRCRLEALGAERFRLPDLTVVAGSPNDGDPRFLEGAPLLVVEVASLDETVAQLERKIDEYFANGCRMAWLVLPEDESVTVRTTSGVMTLVKGETLDGGEVLPGFSLEVAKLFE